MTLHHSRTTTHTPHKCAQPVQASGLLHIFTRLLLGFALLPLLGACATDAPTGETFPTPDYSYLPPLNLNVTKIDISSPTPPAEGSLAAKSPTPPGAMLELMGHQRLHATGTSGHAVMTIKEASLSRQPHHSLQGSYSVQLDIVDPAKNHHGHIVAHVQRTVVAPQKLGLEHNLYTLNTALMDDINVELEYQVRKNLADWLTDATGTPLNAAAIQSQDISKPSPDAAPAPTSTSQPTPTQDKPAQTNTPK